MKKEIEPLSEDFLEDLYHTALEDETVARALVEYIEESYLPDRAFQTVHKAICRYYKKYKKPLAYSIIYEYVSEDKEAADLLQNYIADAHKIDRDQLFDRLEEYIKLVKFQQAYRKAGERFNSKKRMEACGCMADYINWYNTFSLKDSGFVDVAGTFRQRLMQNRRTHNEGTGRALVTRFYIDELDTMNEGRDLRGQLTCFLASSGVGKSHIARWIGKNACMIDGLNVLHIQLEGTEKEISDAYSASFVGCNMLRYQNGTIRDTDIDRMEKELSAVSGKLFIKSFPRFNTHVSTLDINNTIQDYKRMFGLRPDIIIVDSGDLLTDASGRYREEATLRHERLAVFQDMKDIAEDEGVWMVSTYQATVEDREWLNNDKNVLTKYNCSEAKGISRPLTHLITLNQTDTEFKEQTMRLYVDKSRWFAGRKAIKIATDYMNEIFYDRDRTLRINAIDK